MQGYDGPEYAVTRIAEQEAVVSEKEQRIAELEAAHGEDGVDPQYRVQRI